MFRYWDRYGGRGGRAVASTLLLQREIVKLMCVTSCLQVRREEGEQSLTEKHVVFALHALFSRSRGGELPGQGQAEMVSATPAAVQSELSTKTISKLEAISAVRICFQYHVVVLCLFPVLTPSLPPCYSFATDSNHFPLPTLSCHLSTEQQRH